MTPTKVEQRLRLVCRALAVAVSLGAIVELWLVSHTGSLLRLLPFGLCAIVLGSVTLVSLRATRGVVVLHRLLMVLVMLGGAYGVYAHFNDNVTFAREIRPTALRREIWNAGLRGASPLLAGGVLTMAAAIGLAGTTGLRPR